MSNTSDAAAEAAALLAVIKVNILTPVAIATFLSCLLLGVLLALGANYFARFPNDRVIFKVLVGYLLLLSIGDTMNNCSWGYTSLVNFFGDPLKVAEWRPQFTGYLFYTGFTLAVCQTFFIWRVWIVSGKKAQILCGAAMLATFAGFAFETYCGVWCYLHAEQLSDFVQIAKFCWLFCGFQLASDVLATGGLVYFVYIRPRVQTKSVAVVQSSPLMRLLISAFTTNSASLVMQVLIMALIGYSIASNSLLYLIVGYLDAKIYAVGVIVALNARTSSSDGSTPSSNHNIPLRSKGLGARNVGPGQSVHVKVEVQEDVERGTEVYSGKEASPYSVTFAMTPATDDGVSFEEKGIARNY